MSLRRFFGRLMLCIVVMLTSTYVQAIARVDDTMAVAIERTKLPPCHHAMSDHKTSEQRDHHNGCCSNFACAVAIIADSPVRILPRAITVYEIDYGSVSRSPPGSLSISHQSLSAMIGAAVGNGGSVRETSKIPL